MVPFGYERKELEKQIENMMPEPQYKRVYLNVTAVMTSSGALIPISFEWEYNTIKIDQILACHHGQSFKYKTNALRFYCRCGQQKFYLFFENGGFGNQCFYIEEKEDTRRDCK